MSFDCVYIDTMNLYYRIYYAQKKYIEDDKLLYSKVLQEYINYVDKVLNDNLYKKGKLYLLWDNPSSKENFRKKIYENYKQNRKSMPTVFYKYYKFLRNFFKYFDSRIFIVYADYLEADDLLLPLFQKERELGNKKYLIISSDFDWSRVLAFEDCFVVWDNFSKVITKQDFVQDFGFMPTQAKVILYKVLMGDKSDNIKKVLLGWKNEILLKLVIDYNSIDEIYYNIKNIAYLSEKQRLEILKNYEELKTIESIVSFIKVDDIKNFVYQSTYCENELKVFLKLINIHNILEKKSEKCYNKDNFMFKPQKMRRYERQINK